MEDGESIGSTVEERHDDVRHDLCRRVVVGKWQVLTAGSPGPVKLSKESQRSGRGVDVFILSRSGIE